VYRAHRNAVGPVQNTADGSEVWVCLEYTLCSHEVKLFPFNFVCVQIQLICVYQTHLNTPRCTLGYKESFSGSPLCFNHRNKIDLAYSSKLRRDQEDSFQLEHDHQLLSGEAQT